MDEYEYKRMDATPQNMTLQKILFDLSNGDIVKNPSYQREYVWSESMQKELVYSIAFGNPIGAITLWKKGETSYVIDGLQRLSTIERFCNNEFFINGKNAKDIIQCYIQDIRKAVESSNDKTKAKILLAKLGQNNPKIFYKDFTDRMKMYFSNQELALININNASESEIRRYFVRIQNQEKLKAGEIINAIDSKVLSECISNLKLSNDGKIKIKSNLGFNSDRKEFEKIYYSLIAILEKKLPLGANDNQIIKYAEDIDKRRDEFANNATLKEEIDNINSNLNDIADLDIKMKIGRTNLKFLIFVAAHDFYGLTREFGLADIMRAFLRVTERFSVFHAYGSRNELTNSLFKDYPKPLSASELDELKKVYEAISMLRKGSHNLEKFEQLMLKLIELIRYEIKVYAGK